MKMLLLTAFMLWISQGIKAQTTIEMQTKDKNAIAAVIENKYLKGIYDGNTDLLKESFHHDALLFGDVKGQPYAKTLDQYIDGVRNRQSPKDSGKPFKGEIIALKVVNSTAVAEVKVKMYDFLYHDMLSFHKINGQWLIVNKMLTDTSGQPTIAEPKRVLTATINILPGFEKEVKDAIAILAEKTKDEEGYEQFDVNLQDDKPQKIVVYEVYKNAEAFEIHKNTAYAQAFFNFVKGKIADDKIDIVFLSALNSNNTK